MNTNENTSSVETSTTEVKKTSLARKIAASDLNRTIKNLEKSLENGSLNSWETGFMADMVAKMKKYGLKTQLSALQVVTMSRLTVKHCIAA